jgi:hypothetical protein
MAETNDNHKVETIFDAIQKFKIEMADEEKKANTTIDKQKK